MGVHVPEDIVQYGHGHGHGQGQGHGQMDEQQQQHQNQNQNSWRFSTPRTSIHVSSYRLGSRLVRWLLNLFVSVLSLLWFLIPRHGQPVRKKAVHELHPLSYLDALRGYLALVIFTGHTMPKTWKWLPKSVLAVPWLQFPFRGGFASLDIFFWISGYAITYRIVGFMHARRTDKALDALVSSIFRRYLRLFLPVLPITLFTVLAVKTGLAIPPREKDDLITGNPFLWWLKDVGHMMNPFTHIVGWWDGETGSRLIDPFWSLNAEFRSSMMLFAFCVGTCKMPTSKRQVLIWLCIPACMVWQVQWASMAFLGMWFAERRQQRVQEQKARSSLDTLQTQGPGLDSLAPHDKRGLHEQKDVASLPTSWGRLTGYGTSLHDKYGLLRLKTPLLYLLFLYSFVVLMNPMDMGKKTYFPNNLLNAITIEHWHDQTDMHLHLCVGAAMMLYPLDQLYPLQRPLLSPFSQYLGELSFGIYAVHFPVRWMVWEPRYIAWIASKYGNDYDTFPRVFPGYVFMAICVLWAADIFRRLDMRVVEFLKHLETRMCE